MADVKWIKITTDIFDDEKIILIESLPDAYAIITVWFKLLCLAGKQNNSGVFLLGRIPYTDKMLATIFRMKETTVTMALQTFEQFGMVELVDGVITIPNWGKHQNLEQLEQRRQYQRDYQRLYRQRQKELAAPEEEERKHLRKQNVNTPEEDKEEDKEKELDKESKRETTLTLFTRLSSEYSFSSELKDKLTVWFKYKTERKEPYKEQGMKSLLTQISNKVNEYGEQAVTNLIDECMASGWKGIIFDRLTKSKRTEMVPKWMNKQPDYNPTPERVKKNGDWLDDFLEGQKQADLQARAEQLRQRLGEG